MIERPRGCERGQAAVIFRFSQKTQVERMRKILPAGGSTKTLEKGRDDYAK